MIVQTTESIWKMSGSDTDNSTSFVFLFKTFFSHNFPLVILQLYSTDIITIFS